MLLALVSTTLSFAAEVVAGAPIEVFGSRVDALTYDKYCQIRDRLNELSADANYDLQRAVHASHWQAISFVCAMRAEQVGINADALFMRDRIADWLTGWLHRFEADAPLSVTDGVATRFNSSPGFVAGLTGRVKKVLRPAAPRSLATSEEIDWLERALLGCWERTAAVREPDWQLPANEADAHIDLLLQRPLDANKNRLDALRHILTLEMEGDVALAFGEPPTLPDGTCPLLGLLQKHWYELFRGCFHAAIKNDQKVFNISQSQMLAELVCRLQPQGGAASLSLAEFTGALDRYNADLISKYDSVLQAIRGEGKKGRRTTRKEGKATRQVVRKSGNEILQEIESLRQLVIRLSLRPLTAAEQQERAGQMHALLGDYNQGRVVKWSDSRYALDERFVNLTLLRDAGRDQQERWQEPPEQSRFHDLNEALDATRDDAAIVLLGVPGSGKSTLLRHLQLQHCQEQLAQPTGALSLLADLNEYHGELAPREWLAKLWERRAPQQLAELMPLDRCLTQGGVLLLLDALNEMSAPDKSYADLVGQWQEFIQQHSGPVERRNRIVFTCRRLDYSETLSSESFTVPQLQVQPMDETQMREFIAEYAPRQQQYIWDKLDKAPPEQRLRELYQTPFYLRMLCALVEATGNFPTGRAALFTGFVRQALKEELEKKNQLLKKDALLSEFDRRQITQALWSNDPFALPKEGCLLHKLSELAFAMQRKDKLTQSTQVSVSRQAARKFLDAAELTSDLLKAGFALKILDEKNDGQTITFFHQLIQEYFAARQLARQPEPALVHTEWEIGKVSESLADTLARLQDYEPLLPLEQTGWEVTAEIAAPMANDPETFIRNLIPHNLPLAARCAVSPELTISDKLKKQLQDALLERATDKRPSQADVRARIAAGEALGLLGHPGFTRHTGQYGEYLLPPFAPIPGGDYLIGDDNSQYPFEKPARRVPLAPFSIAIYPVTNAEYELFLRAGGYDNEQWWDTPAAREWLAKGGRAAERARITEVRDFWIEQGEEVLRASIKTKTYKDDWARYIAMTDDEFEELLDEVKPLETAPPRQPEFWKDPRFNQPTQPVVGVTWHEAHAYCNWLTANAANGAVYRLPTEAEFEAAARGREGRQYPYGNKFDATRCNTFESHIRRTTPVGIFANATPEGVFDLSGNAWTWTLSRYQGYPYDADDGRENIEAEGNRVLRGGSWYDDLVVARAAVRNNLLPADRDFNFGFRVVQVRPPSL